MFGLIVASQCSKVSYVCVTTIYVGMAKRPYINHAVFPDIPLDDFLVYSVNVLHLVKRLKHMPVLTSQE